MSRRVGYRSPDAKYGTPAEVRKPAADKGHYIAPSATIHEFVSVHNGTYRATHIGPDVWLMAHVHVGHDCQIGEGAEVAPHATLCGEVTIGPWAKIGANATILPGRTIGQRARIGSGAVVTHDVPPGEVWAGNPARRLDCSSAPEPTTQRTPSRLDTLTLLDTITRNSGPITSSPATAADDMAAARSASPGTSAKPMTLPKRPPGGFIEASAPPAPSSARSVWTHWVDL